MSLKIDTRTVDEVVILDISGRLWAQEMPLRDRVRDLLENGQRFMVLNLENVDYIDSTGLGQLISIWTSVRSKTGNINLLRPTERVRRVLKTTALHVVFDVFDDEKKACIAVRRDWPK